MISFAAKLRSGDQFVGIGLSDSDLARLKMGDPVLLDLASVGIGLWIREPDGSRTFLQPRDSRVLIMLGDSTDDIGELLQVDLSSLKKP